MKKVLIVLECDPGHGGTDSGAVANGLREKDLTLKMAQLIGKYLSGRVDVRFTRTADKYVGLSERANKANKEGVDYFLSIHFNKGGGTGFESFVYLGADKGRTAAVRSKIHDKVAAVFKRYGLRDRGKKEADFAVLRETTMPAVLLEYGFLDSAKDSALFKDDNFLDELARATADGLAEAFDLPAAEPANDPLQDALSKLQKAGVIDSPDYWTANARAGGTVKGDYAALLIKRLADKL
ncbi:N-acetylmuramoyl-L-alanine amidase [Paenibacillus sp. FJAT-26967]|uniref:N-acetylmuramoyl-L-alanine amidase family protein n=1 Tax=Paenibacillus sp. FJAT-26967 TaxID=1729690 RepID=UPI000A03A5BD|nr:N-acetylmuramoyl-L-alanine amidase [Paenibacillus sp. FJAT-26967]